MKRQLHIPTHHANGEPTHWPDMVLSCLSSVNDEELPYVVRTFKKYEKYLDLEGWLNYRYSYKLHHIVPAAFECDHGDDIEFLAVTPEGEKFPFAPLVKCTGTQFISVNGWNREILITQEWIGNERPLKYVTNDPELIKFFARNEGFDNHEGLFKYAEEKIGRNTKLIHWTDKRY